MVTVQATTLLLYKHSNDSNEKCYRNGSIKDRREYPKPHKSGDRSDFIYNNNSQPQNADGYLLKNYQFNIIATCVSL